LHAPTAKGAAPRQAPEQEKPTIWPFALWVIAVGPGAWDDSGQRVALDVEVGDRILFGKWSGSEVKIDGEDLLIMKQSDILGILDPVAALSKAA